MKQKQQKELSSRLMNKQILITKAQIESNSFDEQDEDGDDQVDRNNNCKQLINMNELSSQKDVRLTTATSPSSRSKSSSISSTSAIVSNFTENSIQRINQLVDAQTSTSINNNPNNSGDINNNNNNRRGKEFAFENHAYEHDGEDGSFRRSTSMTIIDSRKNASNIKINSDVDGDGDGTHQVNNNKNTIDGYLPNETISRSTSFSSATSSSSSPLTMKIVTSNSNDNNNNNINDETVQSNHRTDANKFNHKHIGLAVSFSSGSEENASSTAQEDDRDENDELSDVSTTIIDGKRAISLSNFGKYAEREGFELYHRNSQPTFGYPMASAGFRANKNNFIK